LKARNERIFVGETAAVEIVVRNTYPLFYPYVSLSEINFGNILRSSFAPAESKVLVKELSPRRYGVYRLGPLNIEIRDGFQLFSYSRDTGKCAEIRAYPKLIPIQSLHLEARQQFGTIPVNDRIYEDYTSISDTRKYRYGDNLKRIHWKTSAKKGELYVKNYEQLADNTMSIFLDRFEGNYGDALVDEKAMEYCVSLFKYYLELNIPTKVVTATAVVEGRNIHQFTELLDKLILLEPKEEIKVSAVLKDFVETSQYGDSLTVITPYADFELVDRLSACKAKGCGVVVFVVTREKDVIKYSDVLTFLNDNGIYARCISA